MQPQWRSTKEEVEVGKIDLNPDNPKTPQKGEMEALVASLERDPNLMNYNPLHVVKDGERYMVVDGNHRLLAIRQLGWDSVMVEIYDDVFDDEGFLDQAKINERLFRNNASYVSYDTEKIANLDMPLDDMNFLDQMAIPEVKDLVYENLNLDPETGDVKTFYKSISFKFEDEHAYNDVWNDFCIARDRLGVDSDIEAFKLMIDKVVHEGKTYAEDE